MTLEIIEIFSSFQGEGPFIGTPATFIRLAECNLNCSFCDTDFTKKEKMGITTIIEKIEEYSNKLIVITGGEPLLQDITFLCSNLLKKGYQIQIETNGTPTPLFLPYNVTYVISPKINLKNTYNSWKYYNNIYFKFIIQNKSDLEKLNNILDKSTNTIFLQPEFSKAKEITELILNTPLTFNYRISGQLHKYLGVE
ncbi:7-carboxy-7-deazaguanine synthase QueE [uncultured Methanobrevibacter sp.]|uniref:7-carboxy-7-deazaguanine synthase QueE n=1 Tax=uncultured Methanobrevibacter sp. TaxID=253161 RepID=UPI0026096E90|nr:7-carboxy-7-deazaguanine synthase QueE [uncultured Methanobrevibacter sp.]